MKDKRIIIIISIVTAILILLLIGLFTHNSKSNTKLTTTVINNNIESTSTTTTGVINENNPGGGDHGGGASTTTSKIVSTTTKVKISTTSTTTTTTKTYYCPNGYKLDGTKCIISKEAEYKCPSGMTEIKYNGISEDKNCINLSEENIKPEGGCPAGTYEIHQIGFMGTPDLYKCYTFYNKVYVCDDGYTLNNKTCIKTINASIK